MLAGFDILLAPELVSKEKVITSKTVPSTSIVAVLKKSLVQT